MKIMMASVSILTPKEELQAIPKKIEQAGRVCYKSEHKITPDSATTFCEKLVKSGHEAVLEHGTITVKFITDRGVSHEIVRHRMASYCQESTRYCNYSSDKFGNEITVILPSFLVVGSKGYDLWKTAMENAENSYFAMLDFGYSPQEARDVLPTSLKTEIVMTANIREWRHFIKLRSSTAAHPQIRELAHDLKINLQRELPCLFGDLGGGENE